jgi:DNA invertase Pin-like site-specific DNA recombinase
VEQARREPRGKTDFQNWADREHIEHNLCGKASTRRLVVLFWQADSPAFADLPMGDFRGVQLGRVAIYCRVSTDDQSCDRQVRDLKAFAKRSGHQVVGVFKETASGAKNDRVERKKVLSLAQAREIDAILVTELSRWGRSTADLVQTLDDLHGWKVSLLAQAGLSFDLSTSSGKLMRTIMAGLAEFERDLIRERVTSGLQAARARGVRLGRQHGQRPSEKKAKRVLALHREGLSYRLIGRNVGLIEHGHGDREARGRTARLVVQKRRLTARFSGAVRL